MNGWLSKLKASGRAFEIFSPHKRQALFAMTQSICAGLLEAAAIVSLLPLLRVLSPTPAASQSWTLLGIDFSFMTGEGNFLLSLLVFLILGVLSAFTRYRSQVNMTVLEFQIVTYVHTKTTSSLLECPWLTYLKLKAGETYKAMLLEAYRIGLGCRLFLMACAEAGVILVMTVACAVISWKMTLWTLAFASLGTIGFLLCGVNVQKRSSRLADLETDIAEMVSEAFANFKTIRLSGRKNAVEKLFAEKFSLFERQASGVHRVQNLIRFLAESGALLFIVLFISVGAFVLKIDFASLLIFLAIFYRIIPRVMSTNSNFIAAGVELRLFDSWRARLRLIEGRAREKIDTREIAFDRVIQLREVSFRPQESGQDILQEISCEIPQGAFIGIVGTSGAGKTTLLDLLAGLIEPTQGEILIDNTLFNSAHHAAWQQRLGIVEQSSALFFGKIKDNIAWGSSAIDEEELRNAARLAHIEQLIERLPGQYDAVVGKGGITLSGGEVQRLALARALYRSPRLLLLDEATSALDLEAENKVLEAIESVRGSCTIVMVSHRLQTVRKCDVIFVLEKGRIIERGSWSELTSDPKSYFNKLVQFQEIT